LEGISDPRGRQGRRRCNRHNGLFLNTVIDFLLVVRITNCPSSVRRPSRSLFESRFSEEPSVRRAAEEYLQRGPAAEFPATYRDTSAESRVSGDER
jgi:hypothetical protein